MDCNPLYFPSHKFVNNLRPVILHWEKIQGIFTVSLISPIGIWGLVLLLKEGPWIPSIQLSCTEPSLVEIGSVIVEKKFLTLSLNYHYSAIIFPWNRDWSFIWAFTQWFYEPSLVELCRRKGFLKINIVDDF